MIPCPGRALITRPWHPQPPLGEDLGNVGRIFQIPPGLGARLAGLCKDLKGFLLFLLVPSCTGEVGPSSVVVQASAATVPQLVRAFATEQGHGKGTFVPEPLVCTGAQRKGSPELRAGALGRALELPGHSPVPSALCLRAGDEQINSGSLGNSVTNSRCPDQEKQLPAFCRAYLISLIHLPLLTPCQPSLLRSTGGPSTVRSHFISVQGSLLIYLNLCCLQLQ